MPEEDIDIGELTAPDPEPEPEAAPKKRGKKAAEPAFEPEGPKLVKVRVKNNRQPRLEAGLEGLADKTIVEVPEDVARKWCDELDPPAAERSW